MVRVVITFVFALMVSATAWAGNWNQSKSKDGFLCEVKSPKAYTSHGKKIKHVTREDGVTTFPGYYELPQNLKPCANDATLTFHYKKWLSERHGPRFQARPSDSPRELKHSIKESEFLDKQLQKNGVLSYLYFADGAIIYDAIAPQSRFGFPLNEKTEFRSNSIGKSIVSYLIGHAICAGHIKSVDEPLNSWPILNDTLYANLKLIDVLNMRAGDHHVVTENQGFIKTGRWFNPVSIKSAALNELKGTKPQNPKIYNYNGFATNVAMNFMIFKVGDTWGSFLNSVFSEKIKVKNRVIFNKADGSDDAGVGWYSAYATRHDYLRIAMAMMEDWQKGTCVGEYLKEMHERRMPIGKMFWGFDLHPSQARERSFFSSKYGGQFHFDYKGMENRNIIGMDGYGGQSILIDMDNSRIVVVNATSTNYDWYELVYQPIKTGKLRSK